MMEEEEEDTLFDQEGLLGRRDEAVSEKKELKCKLLKTAALSMSFFCLGLCVAIPGPTLLDLSKRVNRSIEHMTFIFTARSVGYLIGSLIGGVLFDFFDQQILLFYTMSAVAVATASIPWCTALIYLSALICVQGFALGVLDTGGNIFCIKIWTQKSAPFMQTLHFAFGVGAFIAPLMARPFLVGPIVLSNNITKADYYPVNFKLPLESVSVYSRFVRGLHHPAFWDLDYTLDHEPKHNPLTFQPSQLDSKNNFDGVRFTNPVVSDISHRFRKLHHNYSGVFKQFGVEQDGLHDVTSRRSVEDMFARYKREKSISSAAENGTDAGNNTQIFDNMSDMNSTTTITSTTTTVRPKKPNFLDGVDLNGQLADSGKIIQKLKDIINNPPTENLKSTKELMPGGDNSKDLDSNKTSSLANVTAPSHDTDNMSGNNTFLTEDTIAAEVSTAGVTTTSTTASASTTTSTTTESATTESTTTESTTTITSTTVTTTTPTTTTASSTSSTTTVRPTTPSTTASTAAVLSTSTSNSPSETTNSAEFATKPFEAVDELSTVNTSDGRNISGRSEDDLFSNVYAAVRGMSKIQIAYSLIGMLLATNAGLFLFLYCKDRAQSSPTMTRSHEDLTRPPDTKCFISLLIILLFMFFFTYVGMEVTFGGLLTTFAVVYYPLDRWTPSTAAVLTALFWGCVALGRCFAIFIARCFKPPCMMVSNLSLTLLGAVILSFLVQLNSAMLWVGTITLGLGMSSLFPTTISWANSYYPLTGRATAIFVAGSGIGEMVIPVMTGYLFEKVNRMSLMYVTLTLSTLMSLVYLCLQLVVYQRGRTGTRRSHSGFMRLNNSDDMNDAVDMDTIEFSERGVTDITELSMNRSHIEEGEERKKNGDAYNATEFTRLVELSD